MAVRKPMPFGNRYPHDRTSFRKIIIVFVPRSVSFQRGFSYYVQFHFRWFPVFWRPTAIKREHISVKLSPRYNHDNDIISNTEFLTGINSHEGLRHQKYGILCKNQSNRPTLTYCDCQSELNHVQSHGLIERLFVNTLTMLTYMSKCKYLGSIVVIF